MLRIIDGCVFEGTPSEDRYRLTMHDLGHGHREACVQRAIDWEYCGPLDPNSINAQILRGEREPDPLEVAEKKAANLKRAARRAKSNVRRKCKAQGLDSLLTLTYRANQTDQALCEAHLKQFLRVMREQIDGFVYVACFERQARGAWHVHLAVRRLPVMIRVEPTGPRMFPKVAPGAPGHAKSFNVVRAIWRRIVGEFGGNIDQGRWKGNARKSSAKCAAYISKYVLKMFEAGEDHAKRFRASRCEVPVPTQVEIRGESLAQLIERVMVEFGCERPGVVIATAYLSRFKDVFFVATERG